MTRSAMTPVQRMQALYARQPVDKVVFLHHGAGYCANNAGYPIADMYKDPETAFRAHALLCEQYGVDGTPFFNFLCYGPWEFGGEIKFPEKGESGPSVTRRPVNSPEDLEKLRLPDVPNAGCIPTQVEFARLQEKHGAPISFICGSPFTCAANLCGVENIMMWSIEEPGAVHKALRLMTDHLLQVSRYFVDTFGKDRIIARSLAPTESNKLISPIHFEEFALPYLKELHSEILEMGVKSIYCHICSEQNQNLPLWAQVPFGDPGMLSFGHEVDLATAAEHFPGQIIAGNVNPTLLANGAHEEVYEACRQAIERGKQYCASGYVLMAGCGVPATTPPYHIYLMSKARDEFGRYD